MKTLLQQFLYLSGRVAFVIIAAAKLGAHKAEGKDAIRVERYEQYVFVEAIDETHCRFRGMMCDDPRGDIPKKLINWASKKAVPQFLDSMVKSADAYPAWKATN